MQRPMQMSRKKKLTFDSFFLIAWYVNPSLSFPLSRIPSPDQRSVMLTSSTIKTSPGLFVVNDSQLIIRLPILGPRSSKSLSCGGIDQPAIIVVRPKLSGIRHVKSPHFGVSIGALALQSSSIQWANQSKSGRIYKNRRFEKKPIRSNVHLFMH